MACYNGWVFLSHACIELGFCQLNSESNGAEEDSGDYYEAEITRCRESTWLSCGFRSKAEEAWYREAFATRTVFIERPIGTTWSANVGVAPFYIRVLHPYQGWLEYLSLSNQECNTTMVREFAASLVKIDPPYSYRAHVRGRDVNLNLQTVSELIHVPLVDRYVCPWDGGRDAPTAIAVATYLTNANEERAWDGVKLPMAEVSDETQMLFLVLCNSILLTKHKAHIYLDTSRVMYAIQDAKPICLVRLLIQNIVHPMKKKNLKEAIPNGVLITRLCHRFGVANQDGDLLEPQGKEVGQATINRSAGQKKGMEERRRKQTRAGEGSYREAEAAAGSMPPGFDHVNAMMTQLMQGQTQLLQTHTQILQNQTQLMEGHAQLMMRQTAIEGFQHHVDAYFQTTDPQYVPYFQPPPPPPDMEP